jgi:hypothetical protein
MNWNDITRAEEYSDFDLNSLYMHLDDLVYYKAWCYDRKNQILLLKYGQDIWEFEYTMNGTYMALDKYKSEDI